jgi:hypothetical protein
MNRKRLLLGLLALSALPTSVLLARQTAPRSPRVFDDFSSTVVGEFPGTWKWRLENASGDAAKAKKDGVDVSRWVVRSEGANKYLHIRDEYRPGATVSLFIQTDESGWKLSEHPILSWRWRVSEIPPGADERYTDTNDTPASVAVVYGTRFPFTPIVIRWVWSSTLPVGAVAYRPGRGRPYIIVVGSGSDRLGEWITVERNLVEDYVAIFGKEPPNEPKGIQISTDANRTPGGASDADYDDFRALARYSPGFPKEPRTLLKQYMQGNK